MKTFARLTAVLLGTFAIATQAGAQQTARNITCEEYISTFAPLAIQHQKLYGIPASIKIAQGILESRYGNSDLSRRSNNHFGIKCKSNWQGETVKHDDDAPGECFRKYDSAMDSYIDHSEFLKNGQRYAFLFDLKPTDYKGWANGLKKAGYATAPTYAASLIKCIEDYELYLLDEGVYPSCAVNVQPVISITTVEHYRKPRESVDVENYTVSTITVGGYGVFYNDEGTRFIVAKNGESYKTLAQKLGIAEQRLLRYNGKGKNAVLAAGDKILIEAGDKKRKV